LIVSERIPGTERNFVAENRSLQYIGKLTWSPTENDRIEVSHRGTPSASGGEGKFSVDYGTGRPLPNPYNGESLLGNYGAMSYRQGMAAYDTSVKWTHSALNKRLTFDTIVGWHKQRTYDLASDGTAIESNDGLSGTNPFRFQFSRPLASITDFETLPDPSVCDNPVAMGAVRCPAQRYTIGGPGLLQDRSYNRYQVRELVTFVAEALGHHIIKAGFDFEYMDLHSAKKHPGNAYLFGTRSAVDDYRRYGGLTGPDQAYDTEPLKYNTSSIGVGAFLQDSWSIADVITLNAGFRYDSQVLYTNDKVGLSLPNQWSPRIGIIYDPTHTGRAKLFANYAVYYQSIPLNIMDRAGSGEPQIASSRSFANCDPSSPGYPESCRETANLDQVGGPASPDRNFYYASVGKIAVDPDIKPPSSSELSLGGEYEIIPQGRLGLTYLRRWTNNIIEDMSRDALGNVFFLGNPGRGIASDFPEATRTYDAGILSFTKAFGNAWLAQASYSLAFLRGNWEGMFRSQTGQLDPGSNADFDLRSLTINRSGALDGDRRHEIKVFVARDFALAPKHHINVGLGYRSSSGAPNNYLGRHFRYGNDEVFILPRGTGIRSPWVHNFDLHIGYMFYESKTSTLSVTADIFNLFNFRAATRLSNRYTLTNVQPNTTDDPASVIEGSDKRNIRPSAISTQSGAPFTEQEKYLGYGTPVAYQEPLTIRFGVKGTF
jgi:outer membrane receptor protein involved in Fe transport